jgi:hypothetical protein
VTGRYAIDSNVSPTVLLPLPLSPITQFDINQINDYFPEFKKEMKK